mmetsp:Transcript_9519/g.39149  ORF Transcript_9519/g.39149 Transcript_9519/m.39149 type:complete len:383 (+) Transcript_9519:4413-5561(+)
MSSGARSCSRSAWSCGQCSTSCSRGPRSCSSPSRQRALRAMGRCCPSATRARARQARRRLARGTCRASARCKPLWRALRQASSPSARAPSRRSTRTRSPQSLRPWRRPKPRRTNRVGQALASRTWTLRTLRSKIVTAIDARYYSPPHALPGRRISCTRLVHKALVRHRVGSDRRHYGRAPTDHLRELFVLLGLLAANGIRQELGRAAEDGHCCGRPKLVVSPCGLQCVPRLRNAPARMACQGLPIGLHDRPVALFPRRAVDGRRAHKPRQIEHANALTDQLPIEEDDPSRSGPVTEEQVVAPGVAVEERPRPRRERRCKLFGAALASFVGEPRRLWQLGEVGRAREAFPPLAEYPRRVAQRMFGHGRQPRRERALPAPPRRV